MRLVLLFTLLGIAAAVNICTTTSVDYSISTYDGGCFYGTESEFQFSVTAEHKILKLNTVSGLYEYIDISSLTVGDVVQDPFGTTTVTGVSVGTITSPYVIMGLPPSDESIYVTSFSPFTISDLNRWFSVAPDAQAFVLGPDNTFSNIGNSLTAYYNSPDLKTGDTSTLLDVFDVAELQLYGSVDCGGNLKVIYYYPQQLLSRPLAIRTLGTSSKAMSVNEYFNMIDYIISQPDGVFYDSSNVIFNYTLSIPSCSSVDITTASGYLAVNGYVFA
jgi:hypothetical protein